MSVKLTILGSSGAIPAYGRFPTAQYLVIQNRHFLVDCGEGVQMQLMRYQIPIHKIHSIFISHLHGDHYLGVVGLLSSMHLQKREADLHLHSSRGLDEIIMLHFKYSNTILNYKLVFHLFDPASNSLIYEDSILTVHTIPLIHKLPCAGFIFREKPKPRKINKEKLKEGMLLQHIAMLKKGLDVMDENGDLLYRNADYTLSPRPSYTYSYCSDTAWNEPMIEQISGSDLLYHEATFMEEEIEKAQHTKHSTTREAATIALRSEVKKLIIGHFSARYRDLEPLLLEAKAVFENTELALEGTTFELEA